MNRLSEMRVRARTLAREDRAAWEDAKWQRVAAFTLDVVSGVALGFLCGLALFILALERLAA